MRVTSGGDPVLLSVENVSKTHGWGTATVHALRDVTLQVRMGEMVAVMGPSGSGKSTLLNVAGGLATPTHGTVAVAGRMFSEQNEKQLARVRRRSVGYVFQNFNLIPTLTAKENVALPLEMDGVRAPKISMLVREAIEAVGLAPLMDRFPDQMSGGKQQRIAIARALVGPRRLMLADEPTGALDSEAAEAVMALLRQRVDAGAAALVVTHDPRYLAFADRAVQLHDGVLTQRGPAGSS